MATIAHEPSVSKAGLWTGRVISTLIVLFLLFDGLMKVILIPPVAEASAQMGIPEGVVRGLGVLLMACTAAYAVPATSVFGAILLTGYLGGAVETHVRAGGPVFPVAFAAGFGVLVWGGLYLRDARLRALLPFRRPAA